jgi:hypothetical protein
LEDCGVGHPAYRDAAAATDRAEQAIRQRRSNVRCRLVIGVATALDLPSNTPGTKRHRFVHRCDRPMRGATLWGHTRLRVMQHAQARMRSMRLPRSTNHWHDRARPAVAIEMSEARRDGDMRNVSAAVSKRTQHIEITPARVARSRAGRSRLDRSAPTRRPEAR